MQTFLSHVWVCTQAHISHTCRSCRIHFSQTSHSCFLVLTDLVISYLLPGSRGLAYSDIWLAPHTSTVPASLHSLLALGTVTAALYAVSTLCRVFQGRGGRRGSQCLLYENLFSLFVPLLDAYIQSALAELASSSPHTPTAPYVTCSSGWPFRYCPAWGSHSSGYGNLYWTFLFKK